MNMRYVLRSGLLALVLVIASVTRRRPGEHRHRAAGVSIGINLPVYPQLVRCLATRLLRTSSEFQLFLLRRHVLGLPVGQLVPSSGTTDRGDSSLLKSFRFMYCVSRFRYYATAPYFHGWRPMPPPRWDDHWATNGSNVEAIGTNWIIALHRPCAAADVPAAILRQSISACGAATVLQGQNTSTSRMTCSAAALSVAAHAGRSCEWAARRIESSAQDQAQQGAPRYDQQPSQSTARQGLTRQGASSQSSQGRTRAAQG